MNKMQSLRALAAFALVGLSSPVFAGIPDPFSIPGILTRGSGPSITNLAHSLGMTIPRDWAADSKSDEPCGGFDSAWASSISLYGRGTQVVITAHAPSMCAMAFVVVLDQTATGDWRRIATLRFMEHHVAPRVSYESLISPEHKEIVVTNNEIDYGTGIENIRMTIYSVTDLGASVIFDQPTELAWAVPTFKGNKQTLTDQSETDVYELVDVSDKGGTPNGDKYIHRVERIKDKQAQITRVWDYDWQPEYGAMAGYQTDVQTPMQDFEMEVCNSIENSWVWPHDLLLAGQLGPSTINFEYSAGNVSNIKIMSSSGSALMDKSYVEAITKAQMPPPPASLPTQPLYLTATLDADPSEENKCFGSEMRVRDLATEGHPRS